VCDKRIWESKHLAIGITKNNLFIILDFQDNLFKGIEFFNYSQSFIDLIETLNRNILFEKLLNFDYQIEFINRFLGKFQKHFILRHFVFRIYGWMRYPWRLRRNYQHGSRSNEGAIEVDLCNAVSYRARPGRDGCCGESTATEWAIVWAIPEREKGNSTFSSREITARRRHTQ